MGLTREQQTILLWRLGLFGMLIGAIVIFTARGDAKCHNACETDTVYEYTLIQGCFCVSKADGTIRRPVPEPEAP